MEGLSCLCALFCVEQFTVDADAAPVDELVKFRRPRPSLSVHVVCAVYS